MQLPQISTPVEIGGGSQTSSFSIAMNGKAFRVLSDTLYQNKIGSIVREISCNAYDAHVSAKKTDVPFIIHLPDAFEPFFSVKDFGVGLAPSDIYSVFTVYFESTKDQSNDSIGAFGLGAKTPFSYTDQFTVVSTVNGEKRTYSCYITESGVPSTVEMNCEKTKEPNGVEIIMSVKREDYNTFAYEVKKQLRFFKVKPVINNHKNFSFDTDNRAIIMQDANFKLYEKTYSNNRANAIQGVVGYQIDSDQLNGKLSSDSLKIWNILKHRADILFDIGDIGVTASREGIEYTAHTIAMFEKKLRAISATLTAYVTKELKALKTDWDKVKFVNSNDILAEFASATGGITSTKTVSNGSTLSFELSKFLSDNKLSISSWYPQKIARDKHTNGRITPTNDNIHFVLRDTSNRPNMKAKYLLESNGYDRVYEIASDDITVLDDALITRLSRELGEFTGFTKLSDVVLPIATSTGVAIRGTYNRPSYYVYKGSDASINVRTWYKELEPLSDIDELTVYDVVENMYISDYDSLTAYNRLICLKDRPVLIGVRLNDVKKIENNPFFIKLADYVQMQRNKFESDGKLKAQYRKLVTRRKMYSELPINNSLINNTSELVKYSGKRHRITRLTILASDVGNDANISFVGAIGEFMEWDYHTIAKKRADKVVKIYDALVARYPLLGIYNNWAVHSKVSIEHLALYFKNM